MGSAFGHIEVRGARENNLKNISVATFLDGESPFFTGVSGSGKSLLVFDTIAAESQRLLNETFSTCVQSPARSGAFIQRSHRHVSPSARGSVESLIDIDAVVDENKSLEEGAILLPTFDVGGYHWLIFAQSGFLRGQKAARSTRKRSGTNFFTSTTRRLRSTCWEK